jgi:hypothetical protein
MKRNRARPSRAGHYGAGRHQTGLTLIGFVIVLAVVGLFVYVGMKLVPMYTEYYSVKQALKGLANEPGIAKQDPGRIKDLFFRRLNMSYAENVKPEHVKLERNADGSGWTMAVNYELRRPMIANLDVVGRFDATQALTNRGTDD